MGRLYWKVTTTGQRNKIGNEIGGILAPNRRYRVICVQWENNKRKSYRVHNIAWYLFNGEWPTTMLDHKNGTKDDNRITNLRLATSHQNATNVGTIARNTSGYRNVSYVNSLKKWRAIITIGGKKKILGEFDNKEDAARVVEHERLKIDGEFYHRPEYYDKLFTNAKMPRRGPQRRFNDLQITFIRNSRNHGTYSAKQLGIIYNVEPRCINRILSREIYAHVQ